MFGGSVCQSKTLPSLSFTKLHWQGNRIRFKLREELLKRSKFFRLQIFGVKSAAVDSSLEML